MATRHAAGMPARAAAARTAALSRSKASAPEAVVEPLDVAGGQQAAAVALQRRGERRVGLDALAGAQGPARPVARDHRAGRHELAGAQRAVEGPRPPDAHRAAQAQALQVGHDDGGAGPADAGALDGERRAVQRDARVAPQAAVVVEHPRRLAVEHARQGEGLAGIVGQQRALGKLRGRV